MKNLAYASRHGLHSRVPDCSLEYEERLDYELSVISEMGYETYFLVLAHVMREARANGIVFGPGRGSAGGSLVAYALGITDLDPIAHNLLFERFLNPSRKSLPDIDIDVAESQRQSLIDLVRELYGDDHVAIIGTFGTIGSKAALKDASRVLGHPYKTGEDRCRHLPPPKFGRSPGLDEYSGPKDSIFDLAVGLEGLVRSRGQHAAGVIISPEPLTDCLPLWRPAGQKTWVTGFNMHEVADLGYIKYDFLGLRNLDVIDQVLRTVGMEWSDLPTSPEDCNDEKTYRLLSGGNSLGVFQLDGAGMRTLLRQLKPKRFSDISAALALYRPGPMGANAHTEFVRRSNKPGGWRSEWALHPELDVPLRPVLEETYGLIVYQEQVLSVLNVVCGWSYAEAGLLFDAMRKKNHEKMEATKPSFYSSGQAQGFSNEALGTLWDILVPFSDYSFNRAHTAGYGLIAYWTAYLKANFSGEYMSGLLSSVSHDPPRLHEYLDEARRIGLSVLSPDINISGESFTPDGETVRYGLTAIKGVGDKAVAGLLSKRPYSDLGDLLRRVPANCLNASVLAALCRSGALDSLEPKREDLEIALPELLQREQERRQAQKQGQPLFVAPTYCVPAKTGRDMNKRRSWELETLGVALSEKDVHLVARQDMGVSELEFMREIFRQNPGGQSVSLHFGGATLSECATLSLTDKTTKALEAVGLTVYEC